LCVFCPEGMDSEGSVYVPVLVGVMRKLYVSVLVR